MDQRTAELVRCLAWTPRSARGLASVRGDLVAVRASLAARGEREALLALAGRVLDWAFEAASGVRAQALAEVAELLALDLGHAEGPTRLYEHALSLAPLDFGLTTRARETFGARGDFARVEWLYLAQARAVERNPQATDGDRATALRRLGDLRAELGSVGQAVAAYEKLVDVAPDLTSVRRLAELLVERNEPGDAEDAAALVGLTDELGGDLPRPSPARLPAPRPVASALPSQVASPNAPRAVPALPAHAGAPPPLLASARPSTHGAPSPLPASARPSTHGAPSPLPASARPSTYGAPSPTLLAQTPVRLPTATRVTPEPARVPSPVVPAPTPMGPPAAGPMPAPPQPNAVATMARPTAPAVSRVSAALAQAAPPPLPRSPEIVLPPAREASASPPALVLGPGAAPHDVPEPRDDAPAVVLRLAPLARPLSASDAARALAARITTAAPGGPAPRSPLHPFLRPLAAPPSRARRVGFARARRALGYAGLAAAAVVGFLLTPVGSDLAMVAYAAVHHPVSSPLEPVVGTARGDAPASSHDVLAPAPAAIALSPVSAPAPEPREELAAEPAQALAPRPSYAVTARVRRVRGGKINAKRLRASLEQALGRATTCEVEGRERPLELTWLIAASGRVEWVRADGRTRPQEVAKASCLTDALERARFPRPRGGATRVDGVLSLRARALVDG